MCGDEAKHAQFFFRKYKVCQALSIDGYYLFVMCGNDEAKDVN